jgi:hypothetical protein
MICWKQRTAGWKTVAVAVIQVVYRLLKIAFAAAIVVVFGHWHACLLCDDIAVPRQLENYRQEGRPLKVSHAT